MTILNKEQRDLRSDEALQDVVETEPWKLRRFIRDLLETCDDLERQLKTLEEKYGALQGLMAKSVAINADLERQLETAKKLLDEPNWEISHSKDVGGVRHQWCQVLTTGGACDCGLREAMRAYYMPPDAAGEV